MQATDAIFDLNSRMQFLGWGRKDEQRIEKHEKTTWGGGEAT